MGVTGSEHLIRCNRWVPMSRRAGEYEFTTRENARRSRATPPHVPRVESRCTSSVPIPGSVSPMERDAKHGHVAVRLRLTLTWFVGCGVMIVATYAGTAALFGGLAVAAVGVVIVLAISTVAMAEVHRVTSGSRSKSSTGWGFGVSLSSLTLAGLTATAWRQSGQSFGPMPLLWAAVGGLVFVLCAAAASRRTAIPAGLAVAGLVVVAVVSLVPAGTFRMPARVCPNELHQEAAAYCVP